MIAIVTALCSNGVIGNNGDLVCRIKNDMKRFKNITMGHTVVMGYNTYVSLPNQKPLEGRRNIILSTRLKKEYPPEGFEVANDVDEVLRMTLSDDFVFIIGGAKVYAAFMSFVERMFVTYIDCDFEGDAHFPDILSDEWEMVRAIEIEDDPTVAFTYHFLEYRRLQQMQKLL